MTQEQRKNPLEKVGDASSVLLLTPSLSEDGDDVCVDLLHPEEAATENMLWVSYTKPPDVQLRRWRSHGGAAPANLGIVSVAESTRSVSAASAGGGGPAAGPGGPIQTVASPTDLTGLGIAITEHLQRWADNDYRTMVCFDSLTAMLQYVDVETAYEFLHLLTGRLYAVDAVAHFHMDPGAHDARTVAALLSLCDAVVDLRGDRPTVRRR